MKRQNEETMRGSQLYARDSGEPPATPGLLLIREENISFPAAHAGIVLKLVRNSAKT